MKYKSTVSNFYYLSDDDKHVSKRLLRFIAFHYIDYTKETYCNYWYIKRYLEILYTVDNWKYNNASN